MPVIKISRLHDLAKQAANRMIDVSYEYQSNLAFFSERQLVFEIGIGLRNAKRRWVAFESPYKFASKSCDNTKVDILAFNRRSERSEFHWVEVKSTGENMQGGRENRFKNLETNDFKKLRDLHAHKDIGDGIVNNFGYWVWLYVFKTNLRNCITKKFPNLKDREWTPDMKLIDVAKMVGNLEKRQRTLGVLLKELEEESKASVCSCIPSLESDKFSALLVTCRVK